MARSTATRVAPATAKKVTSTVTRRAAGGTTPAARKSSRTTTASSKKSSTSKNNASAKAAAKPSAKKAATKKASTTKAPATKAPAKKAPAKRAPAKKAPAKTAPAKKASAKKAPAKKASAKKASAKKAPAKTQARRLAVKADEKPWTTAELAEVRAELDADAARLRAELHLADVELAHLMRDAGDGAGNDQADVGSTTFERDHEMSLANNAREMLAQTERALARIDDGSYGVCESCGQPIGKMRVMAFPRATLCLSCKQREERR